MFIYLFDVEDQLIKKDLLIGNEQVTAGLEVIKLFWNLDFPKLLMCVPMQQNYIKNMI